MTTKWFRVGRDTRDSSRRDLPTPRHPNRIPATVDRRERLEQARKAASERHRRTKPPTE